MPQTFQFPPSYSTEKLSLELKWKQTEMCCICHYEHGFFSGLSCHREVSSISSHSQELKNSFCWAPGLTHLRMCWFSRTSHTDNQMFQHPHFQSGFLLCSIKWLTTYRFAIYSCIYLFMHACMCSFICFTVVTHFLPFLTSSKASHLKSRHEIKTDLIYLTAHTAALTVHDSSVHVTPNKNACLCNLASKCNNSLHLV